VREQVKRALEQAHESMQQFNHDGNTYHYRGDIDGEVKKSIERAMENARKAIEKSKKELEESRKDREEFRARPVIHRSSAS
jgi:hypothetical protein